MIRVHLLPHVLGQAERVTLGLPAPLTARQLIAEHRHPKWAGHVRVGDLVVSVYGKRLAGDELDCPLPDGADVVVCPNAGWAAVGYILLMVALSALGGYISYLLMDPPGLGTGDQQDRGDETSPSKAWDRMHTEYRPGFPVPTIYGEHDTGGQVIYADVDAQSATEHLNLVLALSEGRIESIGEVTGGAYGEADGLGGFASGFTGPALPKDVRVNGNRLDHTVARPGAMAYIRMGEPRQTSLPDPFLGTRAIQTVTGGDLPDAQSVVIATVSSGDTLANLTLIFAFPSGSYQQDSTTGQMSQYPVFVDIHWRQVGNTAWTFARNVQLSGEGLIIRTWYFAVAVAIQLSSVAGPLEVRVTRITPRGGTGVVSNLLWRQISFGSTTVYRYPGVALLGLRVAATAQTTGFRSEYVVRVRGRRVRVWDSGLGLSSSHGSRTQDGRYWLVPPVGDPFNGIWTYPPGRNPAWILADFLTDNTRGGVGLSDAELDWATFRDWADFCDRNVSVGVAVEALCQFDAVLDSPRPAWEIVLDICRAGRAVPIQVGNLISIKYEYRDAHGRGTNSVPAKVVTQLFHVGNLKDFAATYRNREVRPAVLSCQFLNRDKDYAQDVIDVEDPEGGFNRPDTLTPLDYVKAPLPVYGLTRPSQVRRDALFRHALNREIRGEYTFAVGIEAFAAEVGDLIDIQADELRPYDAESYGTRAYEAGTGISSIKLTRAVVLAVATTYEVRMRLRDESVASRTITQAAGSYPAGTALSFSGGAINIDKGAPIVFGIVNKLVKTVQVIWCSLNQDMTRQIRALDWVPSVHDIPNVGGDLPEGGDDTEFSSPDQVLVKDTGALEPAEHVTQIGASRQSNGLTTISWERPTQLANARARVYVRAVDGIGWLPVVETKSDHVEVLLPAGQTAEIVVTIEDSNGKFQSPNEVTPATITGDEFPIRGVPALRNGSLVVTGDNALLAIEWEPIDGADVERYEVRRGAEWIVGQLAGIVREPNIELPGPPQLPDATTGVTTETILVRARARHGLFSETPLVLTATAVSETKPAVTDASPDPSTGTLVDLTVQIPAPYELTIAAGATLGTWTSGSYALAYNAEALICFGWIAEADSAELVDDLGFAVDSGEARWRLVDGRPGSPAQPGAVVDDTVDGFGDVLVDDVDDARLVSGWSGEPGTTFGVRVWFRACKTGESISGAAWRPYEGPATVLHDILQWKVELFRDDPDDTIRVRGFRARRFL